MMQSRLIPVTLVLAFCFSHCKMPDYYIKKNKPDAAFKYASNKLNRNKHKTKNLQALEYGFNTANERDIALVSDLKEYDDLKTWKRIHQINQEMLYRQEKIKPYMPLVSKEGYRPYFKMNPVKEWEEESFWKVTDLYMEEINENIGLSLTGKKLKAREANYLLHELHNKHGYKGKELFPLMDSTYYMGKAYFQLNVFSDRHIWNGDQIADWVVNNSYEFNSDVWKEVHVFPQKNVQYDFAVEVRIKETYVSSDNINSSCERYEKEIEVGKKEVKDTSGKVTYEPIYETVSATVTTYNLNKNANVRADILFVDLKTDQIIYRKEICGTDSYSANYCSVSGDSRAVSVCCNSFCPSFPSDRDMLRNSALGLRYHIRYHLKRVDLLE